jgi:hypothetical protein
MLSALAASVVRRSWFLPPFTLILPIHPRGLLRTFVRAIVRAFTVRLLVATLLRDGLFEPGGIGLPPSLPYKADFAL